MFREIEIKDGAAEEKLIELGNFVLDQIEHPSRTRIGFTGLAWTLGLFAVYVYYSETLEFTKDKPITYSHFAVAASLIGNAVVNGFYNNDAVQELFSLKDPVTGEMTVPVFDLGATAVISGFSAFAFAFLVLKPNVIAFLNFILQLVTYTAQHYFSVMTIFRFIREQMSQARNKDSRHAKLQMSKKVEGLMAEVIEKFCQNQHSEIENLFFFEDKISIPRLTNAILEQTVVLLEPPESRWPGRMFFFYSAHTLSLLSQCIGNIGYFNSTINGWRTFFSKEQSIVLSVLTMLPLFWLSFYVSIKNINKITDLLMKIFRKILSGKSREIWHEFPYAIRKSPWFSTITGLGLSVMAIFSFYTALELFMDAVYNIHPDDDPEWFGWLDHDEKLQTLYTEATRISVILFNIFPVPEVQGFLSQIFCYWTGTAQEKKNLKFIWVLESLARRISLVPEHAFGFRDVRPSNYIHINTSAPQRKERCCARVSQCLSWLFCKFTGSSPPQKTSINEDYHSLNGNV